MKKIYCLDDLADVIIDMMVKYSGFKPSEINRHDVIGEFVNYADYLCYLEDIPLNEETKPLYEYIFVNYEAHGECEQRFMKMVFDKNISLAEMKSEAYKEFSPPDEITFLNTGVFNNKFELFEGVFDSPEYWCGLDTYQKPEPTKAELRKKYEEYKLQWLIDHGYSLTLLLAKLDDIVHEAYEEDDFEEWEKDSIVTAAYEEFLDYGFAEGEIWACYDEWLENDYEDQ